MVEAQETKDGKKKITIMDEIIRQGVRRVIRRREMSPKERHLEEQRKRREQGERDAAHLREQKRLMLTMLEKHLLVVTYAAKEAQLPRSQHFKWLQEDPEYKKAVADLRQVLKDFGERKLLEAVNRGNSECIRFFNRTQNKDRGYGDSLEVTGPGGEALNLGTIRQEITPEAIKRAMMKLLGTDPQLDAAINKLAALKTAASKPIAR